MTQSPGLGPSMPPTVPAPGMRTVAQTVSGPQGLPNLPTSTIPQQVHTVS